MTEVRGYPPLPRCGVCPPEFGEVAASKVPGYNHLPDLACARPSTARWWHQGCGDTATSPIWRASGPVRRGGGIGGAGIPPLPRSGLCPPQYGEVVASRVRGYRHFPDLACVRTSSARWWYWRCRDTATSPIWPVPAPVRRGGGIKGAGIPPLPRSGVRPDQFGEVAVSEVRGYRHFPDVACARPSSGRWHRRCPDTTTCPMWRVPGPVRGGGGIKGARMPPLPRSGACPDQYGEVVASRALGCHEPARRKGQSSISAGDRPRLPRTWCWSARAGPSGHARAASASRCRSPRRTRTRRRR